MMGPLDVLAQLIISITATQAWPVDQVFNLVRRATPYANLTRDQFDLIIDMLAGRYAGARIRELKPRLQFDRIVQEIQATKGAVLAYYTSGGTIPDRGYFQMRHVDTGGVLGELDEEFVWEATLGDTFTMGTQRWQVHRITHNDVIVRPAKPGTSAPPFWRNEFMHRSFHFSDRIGRFLEAQEARFARDDSDALQAELQRTLNFEPSAAAELTDFLRRQREHTASALPHRHHLVLELIRSGPGGYQGPDDPQQLVLHTGWGGQVNHPWALALRAAWHAQHGQKLDIYADNTAVVLQVKGGIDPADLIHMVRADNLLELLRQSLESSGFFGARFRECAGRALLLTKQRFNQRLPLWMSRMQSKKLLGQVKSLTSFPVLLETWRTCLDDEFDLPSLTHLLRELHDGTIAWSFVATATPSPFARALTFGQISRYMYADDTPDDDEASALGEDVITQALHNPALRPAIEADVVAEFAAKRQRTHPGYQPETAEDWGEWLKERVLIPESEIPEDALLPSSAHWVTSEMRRWVTHIELAHGLSACGWFETQDVPEVAESRDAWQFAIEILSFYGPLTQPEIEHFLPEVPEGLLDDRDMLIQGCLVAECSEPQWCNTDNFEILLRMQRARRRRDFTALPVTALPAYWARLHRLGARGSDDSYLHALESLRAYPAPVDIWLNDLGAARIANFERRELDEQAHTHGLKWLGTGTEQITIVYPEEEDLVASPTHAQLPWCDAFSDPHAAYTFEQIAEQTGQDPAQLNGPWWDAVWQGQLTTDSLGTLRQAAQKSFHLPSAHERLSNRRRLARAPAAWTGHWRIRSAMPPSDGITELEDHKERVRLLLDRYGLINRDIVRREQLPTPGGVWRWRQAFRALRIMELAGEVVGGYYFTDLATPQFASPRTLAQLSQPAQTIPNQGVFWVNAWDPVAPCGLGLAWPELPARRPGNYLVYVPQPTSTDAGQIADAALALVVHADGKRLDYFVPPDHEAIDEIHGVIGWLLEKRSRVSLASINAVDARTSPYLGPLGKLFTVTGDHKQVILERAF